MQLATLPYKRPIFTYNLMGADAALISVVAQRIYNNSTMTTNILIPLKRLQQLNRPQPSCMLVQHLIGRLLKKRLRVLISSCGRSQIEVR